MKKYEKIGYIIGLLIGASVWIFLAGYTIIELINRLVNDSGDPFPVLTTLLCISILFRVHIMNMLFKKVLDWINK
jgi:hypothetical protein